MFVSSNHENILVSTKLNEFTILNSIADSFEGTPFLPLMTNHYRDR
jgi:hypothetical protein